MPTLYRLTWQTGADSIRHSWHGAMADAKSARAEVRRETGLPLADIDLQPIDFPTKKQPLLDWLNRHLSASS